MYARIGSMSMPLALIVALLGAVSGFLAGCLAEGEQEDKPAWDAVQAYYFSGDGKCTSCHANPYGAGESHLSLEFDQYDAIVVYGMRSGKSGVDERIIDPGSRITGFLYRKITGELAADNSEGYRMPIIGDPLPDEDVQAIGEWIDRGARFK